MVNPFSDPSYLLPPLIASVASLILVAVVWRGATRNRWIFCSLLLSVGLWSFLTFGMRSSPDVHQAVLWDRVIPVAGYAIFVLYYHFALAYTNGRRQTGILVASYLVLAAVAALTPTDLIIERMRLEDYGYAPVLGPIAFPISIIGLLAMGGGAYNLLRRYKASHSYEERNRLLYLVIAVVFPFVGGLLDSFSNLPPAAIWGNLIFCVICSVAILKYHLLDIRVVVRKSLVYLLISAGIAVPYVSLLYLLHYILEPKLGPWWIHALIILLLAIILRPLYSRAQQLADRLFYRDRYDALRALQQFGGEAQSIVNLEELGSNMVQLVSSALRTSSACLLLPSEGNSGLHIVSSSGLDSPPSGVMLRVSSPVVKWLELHEGILSSEQLDIVPQLQSFSLKEKNNLERMGAKLLVPIKTRQHQLSGILVLGQKLSEQSYSGEDKQLLTALTGQMGMALENARLYNASQRELEERKRAEEALSESEDKYRKLFELGSDALFLIEVETGRIFDLNDTALKMYGYSREEALQMKNTDFSAEPAQTRQATVEHEQQIPVRYHKKKDGTIFPTDISVAYFTWYGKEVCIAAIRDITERKQAEERERRLQEELYLSSRLASIGELAAGVAHEINNPLTGILGFSQRMSRKSTDEEVSRGLEIIHNEALRAAKVVENLLTFARRHKPQKEYSDINDILQKALELRAYELKTGNIEVTFDLTPSLPKPMADFHQIQEVFLNIILNAEQAMIEANRGGKLCIKTQQTKGYIRVLFTDDGPGIPAEHLDKLFDPFFTTRGEKGGTGLGLSVCHGIVAEHGGRIYAKSKTGKGTTFFVELPIISETADKNKVGKEEAIPALHKHDRS